MENHLALLICAAGSNEQAELETLFGNFLQGALVESDYPNSSSIAYFTLIVWSHRRGIEHSIKKRQLGQYADAVGELTSGTITSNTVHTLCDYHVDRILSVSHDATSFQPPPFDIVPFEIIYWLKSAGASPEPIHP